MKKDFITVTPDNGIGDGTITVQADSNKLLESRSTSLTIDVSGISKTISVNQHGSVQVFAYIVDENDDYLSDKVIVNGVNMENGDPAYINEKKELNFVTEPIGLKQCLAIDFKPDLQFLSAKSSSSNWEVLLRTNHNIFHSIVIRPLVLNPGNTVVNAIINNMGSITLIVVPRLKNN